MSLSGTMPLTRHGLRVDRVLAVAGLAVLVAVALASSMTAASLYPSLADRVQAATTINATPATVALYGPILDTSSLGELAMTKMTVLYAMFGAFLFVVLVRRHTRLDEERGLAELVGAAPVGRDAAYAATLVESGVLAVVLAALMALSGVAGRLPVGGSVLFGLSWAGTVLVGVAIAAVAMQLAASARTCTATAIGTLLLLFAVRAAGDTAWHPLSWLSPLGWNTQLRAWSHPRVWVLALYPLFATVLLVAAAWLRAHRDLGRGLVADRPGPVHGPAWLGSALGLAVRITRTGVLVWTVALAVFGTVAGAIAPSAERLLRSTAAADLIKRLGGPGSIADSLLAAEIGVLALAITAFAILAVTQAGEDERVGRTEQVRATTVTGGQAWTAVGCVALVGASWLLLVSGLALGLGARVAPGRTMGASLAQLPAVALTAALALLALAIAGRYAVAGWAFLAAFVVLGTIGRLLDLPAWVTGLSPYQHIPLLGGPFSWGPVIAVSLIACVVLAAGRAAYTRRDLG